MSEQDLGRSECGLDEGESDTAADGVESDLPQPQPDLARTLDVKDGSTDN
ncbi:hypothetical protein DB30_01355 [Enhygromyxa salina]|uniref:Uncharacterized protein n=1 Tax=Enhygromyxa salina TaxID=215803 RepID=A0A0C2D515_9BACT|nr:hypothetical protein DB30_01355 [Enhygromyxa salina]